MDPATLAQLSPEEQAAAIQMLLDGPALEPPPGVVPDFVNRGGKHDVGYAVVIVGAALATLAVFFRLYSRVAIKSFKVEDALLISALGLFGGYQYLLYEFSIFPGIEVHQWNIQLKTLPPVLYNTHVGSIFYGLIIMLLKTAILFDWLRLFNPSKKRDAMFWVSHAMIWSNILFYGVGTIVEIFQCSPREKIWNPLFEGGSCYFNMRAHNIASGVINLVSDIIILALPQKVIWKLHASTQRRLGVSLLFAIGIFACAAAAVRLYYLMVFLNTTDQMFTVSRVGLWSIGEMTAGFLIIGIPSIPKFIKTIPVSESLVSLIRTLTRTQPSGLSSKTPRQYTPPEPSGRRNSPPGLSVDEYDMDTIKDTSYSLHHKQSGILRETQVDVTRERAGPGNY